MLGTVHGWRRFIGHALGYGGPFFLGFYLLAQAEWLAPSLFTWLGAALVASCVTLALEIRSTFRSKQTLGKMFVDLLAKNLGLGLGLLSLWLWYNVGSIILGGKVLP